MNTQLRTVLGQIIAFVAATERRRLLVVVTVPLVFTIWLDVVANYGVLILFLAVGLAAGLYTRPTAQKTVAAGVYGVGVLLISLFLLTLYWTFARGSTESLLSTVTRMLWQALLGTVFVGLGLWIRQTEF
ncbi:hypothetical protein [Halosegnis longus]|uniref:Uncharacterized protein n=1 Tax=Halosegnis longus TaxID=2216012 RepID=A0AAJ4UVZ2_9EURY|nr:MULTISPECIES: hypothetical protein [Halobacteriales]RNJ26390.1 hypothetical protein Nmn1133_06730 [Salella cibi]